MCLHIMLLLDSLMREGWAAIVLKNGMKLSFFLDHLRSSYDVRRWGRASSIGKFCSFLVLV